MTRVVFFIPEQFYENMTHDAHVKGLLFFK